MFLKILTIVSLLAKKREGRCQEEDYELEKDRPCHRKSVYKGLCYACTVSLWMERKIHHIYVCNSLYFYVVFEYNWVGEC